MTTGIVIWGNVGIAFWMVGVVDLGFLAVVLVDADNVDVVPSPTDALISDVGFLSWGEVIIVVVLPTNRDIENGSFSVRDDLSVANPVLVVLLLLVVVVVVVAAVIVVVVVVVSCWFSRQNLSANKARLSFFSSVPSKTSFLKS